MVETSTCPILEVYTMPQNSNQPLHIQIARVKKWTRVPSLLFIWVFRQIFDRWENTRHFAKGNKLSICELEKSCENSLWTWMHLVSLQCQMHNWLLKLAGHSMMTPFAHLHWIRIQTTRKEGSGKEMFSPIPSELPAHWEFPYLIANGTTLTILVGVDQESFTHDFAGIFTVAVKYSFGFTPLICATAAPVWSWTWVQQNTQ